MGVQVKWRHRTSRAERFAHRLGALGLVCTMVLVMDYRSAPIILFLYCYFWVTAIATVGLVRQHLTRRRHRG